jgi:hypothetical protein
MATLRRALASSWSLPRVYDGVVPQGDVRLGVRPEHWQLDTDDGLVANADEASQDVADLLASGDLNVGDFTIRSTSEGKAR